MKNAMKKLMSLLLVAVLLVSALPLAASAAVLGGSTDETEEAPSTSKSSSVLGGTTTTTTSTPAEEKDEEAEENNANASTTSKVPQTQNTLGGGKVRSSQVPSGTTDNNGISNANGIINFSVRCYSGTTLMSDDYNLGLTQVILDKDETHVTGDSLLKEHYGKYANAKISKIEVWKDNVKTGEYGANDQIKPSQVTGSHVIINVDYVPNVEVYISYNNRTFGPAWITVPNKTSITIPELMEKAKVDSTFEGLNVSFKDYDYTINGSLTTTGVAYPGNKVVFQLNDASATAGGTLGGITGSTGGDNIGGGSNDDTDNNDKDSTVDIIFVQNGVQTPYYNIQIADGGATIREAMEYFNVNTSLFKNANIDGTVTDSLNTKIKAGNTAYIYLNNSTSGGSTSGSTGSTTYNKFPWDVYLNIYKDTLVGAPHKTINITNGIALDGVVTLDEVKSLVMNYYNAKNSYGISFDGLYYARGNWVNNYANDLEKYGSMVNINELRADHAVYINVMINNAVAKGTNSGVADPSNPKTGDAIFAPIAILGVSATALAAVMFFYNKKRMAR